MQLDLTRAGRKGGVSTPGLAESGEYSNNDKDKNCSNRRALSPGLNFLKHQLGYYGTLKCESTTLLWTSSDSDPGNHRSL